MKLGWLAEGYICGLVTRDEGRRLAGYAAKVPADQTIVELGSQGGSSTSWLAMGAHAGHGATVVAVDLWDGPVGGRLAQHADSAVRARFDAQIAYCASAGYLDAGKVVAVQGDSVKVADTWDRPIGLLHVDALHSYEACRADVEAWAPHVPAGGVVVLHDDGDPRFGVRRVAEEMEAASGWELIGRHTGEWRKRRHGQAIFRKRP